MPAPVTLTVHVPSLLAASTGGQREVQVVAETLTQAITLLITQFPALRHHLFEKDGRQRPHVLLYYNDQDLRWLDNLSVELKAGDSLTILQAVSGGN